MCSRMRSFKLRIECAAVGRLSKSILLATLVLVSVDFLCFREIGIFIESSLEASRERGFEVFEDCWVELIF